MFLIKALHQLWPSVPSAVEGSVWGCLLLVLAGCIVAQLARFGWRIGDTRKLFHVIIFTAAALLRWKVDGGAVTAFGVVIAIGILLAVWQRCRSRLFQALARPGDASYERSNVVVPLLCTAVGGVLAEIIAGPLVCISYLVVGWGDAVGEPVGIRWGKHRYRISAWGLLAAARSWEGSASVFVASSVAATVGLMLVGVTGPAIVGAAFLLGVAATAIEAVSPHGLDNLTLLVSIAWLSRFCIA